MIFNFFLLAPVTADVSGNDSVATGEEEMYLNLPGWMVGTGY